MLRVFLLPALVYKRAPCLQIFDVLSQSPVCPDCRTHFLFARWRLVRSVAYNKLVNCSTQRGVCTSFHVVDVSEDDCKRQVSSCARVCCLFIDGRRLQRNSAQGRRLVPCRTLFVLFKVLQKLGQRLPVFWTTIPKS